MKESGLRVFGEPYGILVESRQIPLMGVTWGGGTKERRNGGKGTRMPECSVSLSLILPSENTLLLNSSMERQERVRDEK